MLEYRVRKQSGIQTTCTTTLNCKAPATAGPGDFFAAGLLLFGSGMADLLATRPAHTTRQKQFVGALVFVVFAVVWAELAVRLLD